MGAPRAPRDRVSMNEAPPPGRGFTLHELLVVLAVLAVLAAIAAPAAAGVSDAVAARGARDATASLLSRGRAEAPARGGTYLSVDLGTAMATLRAGRPGAEGALLATLDLRHTFGAKVDSRGVTEGVVDLVFDAHGIGRVASRTLSFRRGGAEAALTVSSYGRVRRW